MTSYKAFRIHRDNAQHSARIEELELQAPDEGELLIRIKSLGVLFPAACCEHW
ncbi:MAG: hypothetical protein KZQ60_00825 [Candidatus Thiodiazotropha sp. (ex Lucinoma aequizonata)]|nr:hypothetical protein [Candidatus Thiodiazotropha sp. (ex Lucinoma aequizonata)]MCU7888917.1 hypothetical protein [Candidatus Thiodiazotropha sp. (ex Lucinoma aequizonata)]MCU7896226.1 hypothetical protein [Candidatus Thiodiazotropha sp. (ex Lucinoma aequizonata)]MCU7900036.1 hypothetical protein [Candidatus Thiodiazotropha sp. (ex Lucinoma aequizonata)]MCU7909055.1 hypothetical protein [Candidatus Thiodiazotropha sp. (ex Lucinoma aequizonata)]